LKADLVLIGVLLGILATLLLAAAVLARHHIRSGRADRRGAWRVTAYLAAAGMVAWSLRADHSLDLEGEVGLLFREAANMALLSITAWTVYVALEPYVRRLWPDALLGWSRLLTGHIRDPRVGRDLLTGIWRSASRSRSLTSARPLSSRRLACRRLTRATATAM
jgi:hypothetical protein